MRAIHLVVMLALSIIRTALAGQADAVDAFNRGDYATAFREYLPVAEHGDQWAQYMVGQMYRDGQGVKRNLREAAKWYRHAADQGNGPAQYSIGLMYLNGQGVPQDFVLAYKWFNLATGLYPDSDIYRTARDHVASLMTAEQIAEGQRLSRAWKPTRP